MVPHSQRSDVDDVIDHVAAEVTSGEPSADFHANVMARLEVRRPRFGAWTLAAAAAVVVIAALLTNRPWDHRARPVQEHAAVVHSALEPEATTAAIDPLAPGTLITTPADLPTFALPALTLPPIEPIEPITLDSIQPTRLSIPQLTVEPIVMPALDDGGSIRERR